MRWPQSSWSSFRTTSTSASSGSASCVAKPCTPGITTCYAEKFGQCAADGMGVSDGAEDCAANNQVCTASGCVTTATDTLGAQEELRTPSSYQVIGNVVDVSTSRALTGIEAYLELPAPRTLRWLIYERSAPYPANFQLKFDKTTSASGSGFQSSGSLNFKLEANKAYLVGIYISSGSYVAHWNRITKPQTISFGQSPGSITTSFGTMTSSWITTSELYYMRLETTLP